MQSFRTKRGRCVVTDDELRIESGLLSHAKRYWEGNKPLLFGYLLVYAALLAAATNVVSGGNWRPLAIGAVAVAAIVVSGRVLNNRHGVTGDDRIPLHDVEAIEAVAGDDWLTRPRLVIHYWRKGEVKHRYVMMPSGLLSYAEREFEHATELLRAAGLSVEEADPAQRSG